MLCKQAAGSHKQRASRTCTQTLQRICLQHQQDAGARAAASFAITFQEGWEMPWLCVRAGIYPGWSHFLEMLFPQAGKGRGEC